MFSGEGRCGARADTEIEGSRHVGDAGEVNRLMMVRPRDIDEELFGDRVGDGLVIGEDGAVECRRRQAACEAESGQQADQAGNSQRNRM